MNCTETSKENLYNDAGAERIYFKFLVVVLISFLNLKYIPVVRDSQSHENKRKQSIDYCLFENVAAFIVSAKKSLFA